MGLTENFHQQYPRTGNTATEESGHTQLQANGIANQEGDGASKERYGGNAGRSVPMRQPFPRCPARKRAYRIWLMSWPHEARMTTKIASYPNAVGDWRGISITDDTKKTWRNGATDSATLPGNPGIARILTRSMEAATNTRPVRVAAAPGLNGEERLPICESMHEIPTGSHTAETRFGHSLGKC